MLWPSIAAGSTPHAMPQPRQRVLDREERGLRERRLAQPRRRAPPSPARRIEHLPQVEAQPRRRTSAHAVDRLAEDRLRLVEPRAHARVLRPLAGEEEGDRPRPAAPRRRHAPAPRPRSAADRVLRVPADHRAAVREGRRGPPAGCRPRRPDPSSGCSRQVTGARRAVAALERRLRPAPTARRSCQRGRRRARRGRGRLLQHDVGVGAADAERADARAARRPSARQAPQRGRSRRTGWPRSRSSGSASRSGGSAAARACSSASTVLIRPGDAGRGVQVADVRLHRAEGAEAAASRARRGRPGSSAATSIGSPSARAGAVGLDVADRLRRRPRPTASAARDHRAPGPRRWARCSRPSATPSLLIAEPRITAWIVSPSAARPPAASAPRRRRRCRRPCPAPRASKARQWPSGERMPPSW